MPGFRTSPGSCYVRRIIVLFLLTAFSMTNLVSPSYAQAVFHLPEPGEMIGLSEPVTPVLLKGVSLHPEDPLLIDFIVDNGTADLKGQPLTDETTRLVKYFLAGLAVPENELWVNLSPAEKNRIMADPLSHTDAGRDMLAQDYILKQVMSTLMYPENELGRKFWDTIYSQVYAKFGQADIPVDTFNKVWITPDEAEVYQHDGSAFVTKAHLKVMLESDYVAMSHQKDMAESSAPAGDVAMSHQKDMAQADTRSAPTPQNVNPISVGEDLVSSRNKIIKDVLRDIVIPILEKEVNDNKNFAPLRQIFYSLILAGWYKNSLKNSLINRIYIGTNKVGGLEIAQKNAREEVYAQYLQAYQKGVYNFVKEEFDRTTQQPLARKYFAGGLGFNKAMHPDNANNNYGIGFNNDYTKITYRLKLDMSTNTQEKNDAAQHTYKRINTYGYFLEELKSINGADSLHRNYLSFNQVALNNLFNALRTHKESMGDNIKKKKKIEMFMAEIYRLQKKNENNFKEKSRAQPWPKRFISRPYRTTMDHAQTSGSDHEAMSPWSTVRMKELWNKYSSVGKICAATAGGAFISLMLDLPFFPLFMRIIARHTDLNDQTTKTKVNVYNIILNRHWLAIRKRFQNKQEPTAITDDSQKGGIDLGQGHYLHVTGMNPEGSPPFNPNEILILQHELRGLVPIPVGGPRPVKIDALFGQIGRAHV